MNSIWTFSLSFTLFWYTPILICYAIVAAIVFGCCCCIICFFNYNIPNLSPLFSSSPRIFFPDNELICLCVCVHSINGTNVCFYYLSVVTEKTQNSKVDGTELIKIKLTIHHCFIPLLLVPLPPYIYIIYNSRSIGAL